MEQPPTQFTPREREIAQLLHETPTLTQSEVARKLGVSRQAVNNHLRSMKRKWDAARKVSQRPR